MKEILHLKKLKSVFIKPRIDNYENWCFDVYGKYLTEYYRKFTSKYWRTNMEI